MQTLALPKTSLPFLSRPSCSWPVALDAGGGSCTLEGNKWGQLSVPHWPFGLYYLRWIQYLIYFSIPWYIFVYHNAMNTKKEETQDWSSVRLFGRPSVSPVCATPSWILSEMEAFVRYKTKKKIKVTSFFPCFSLYSLNFDWKGSLRWNDRFWLLSVKIIARPI